MKTTTNISPRELIDLMPVDYDIFLFSQWFAEVYRFAVINDYYTLITASHRAMEKENLEDEETAIYYKNTLWNALHAIESIYPITESYEEE